MFSRAVLFVAGTPYTLPRHRTDIARADLVDKLRRSEALRKQGLAQRARQPQLNPAAKEEAALARRLEMQQQRDLKCELLVSSSHFHDHA
jgi:hypothetical protein